jgi:DNA mismatch repair protein MutS2
MASVKRAREELRAAQARLRGGRLTEDDLRAATRSIDAVAHKTSIGGELEPRAVSEGTDRSPVNPGDIRIGLKVFVPRLRAEAEIVEVLGGGQLRVAAGSLKLSTTVNEVRSTKQPGASTAAKSREAPNKAGLRNVADRRKNSLDFDAAADPDVPIQTAENTVDLRGLRAHEATALAEQFLDRALGAGRKVAFLIHGHGTGALREAVRETVRAQSHVEKMRPGEQGEGGDGVTVVWLRW